MASFDSKRRWISIVIVEDLTWRGFESRRKARGAGTGPWETKPVHTTTGHERLD
jgi:hypothetical protein